MSSNQDYTKPSDAIDDSKGFGLTTEEKRAHHIASEQKRRENIRREFDHIADLTPTLKDLERRSELIILNKSADFIDQLKFENAQLVRLCESRNLLVPHELKYRGPLSDGSDALK